MKVHELDGHIWIASADEGGYVLLTEVVLQDHTMKLALRRSLQLKQKKPIFAISFDDHKLYVSAHVEQHFLWFTHIHPSTPNQKEPNWLQQIPNLQALDLTINHLE